LDWNRTSFGSAGCAGPGWIVVGLRLPKVPLLNSMSRLS
jgi:hypothetical protein